MATLVYSTDKVIKKNPKIDKGKISDEIENSFKSASRGNIYQR
jgi:hypothetical protein